MFGNVCLAFGQLLENLRKSLENRLKKSLLVCLYNMQQHITCPLVDTNFIFSCSTRYLTSEHSERVRYRVENSKIKFVSTRGHVTSSISITRNSYANRQQQRLERDRKRNLKKENTKTDKILVKVRNIN